VSNESTFSLTKLLIGIFLPLVSVGALITIFESLPYSIRFEELDVKNEPNWLNIVIAVSLLFGLIFFGKAFSAVKLKVIFVLGYIVVMPVIAIVFSVLFQCAVFSCHI